MRIVLVWKSNARQSREEIAFATRPWFQPGFVFQTGPECAGRFQSLMDSDATEPLRHSPVLHSHPGHRVAVVGMLALRPPGDPVVVRWAKRT